MEKVKKQKLNWNNIADNAERLYTTKNNFFANRF